MEAVPPKAQPRARLPGVTASMKTRERNALMILTWLVAALLLLAMIGWGLADANLFW